jgi:hypothetical protein
MPEVHSLIWVGQVMLGWNELDKPIKEVYM